MIQLYYEYSEKSSLLSKSFDISGFKSDVVSIKDNGFLPDFVHCPFKYFCGREVGKNNKKNKSESDTPLYFNQIKIPDFWEISSDNRLGKIKDKGKLRGNIFYSSSDNSRNVSVVDWFDEDGQVRFCDHYDVHGFKFAQSVINEEQKNIMTIWFSADDRKIKIIQNFVTGNLILFEDNKEILFANLVDFVIYYLEIMKFNLKHIIYDNLYYSYFVAESLYRKKKITGTDILIWSEKIHDDIPDNMKDFFNGKTNRLKHIFIQSTRDFNLVTKKLGYSKKSISMLGYIYSIEKFSVDYKEALIFTNSDCLEQLKNLVKFLPDVNFNIASITEMSSKLLSFNKYNNVSLFPQVSPESLQRLIKKCAIYLDINHGNKIFNCYYTAFVTNKIIFSFTTTYVDNIFVVEKLIFEPKNWQNMADLVKSISTNRSNKGLKLDNFYKTMLDIQKQNALAETKSSFKKKITKYIKS